jgi:MarR family transcriptional regulator, organic hydroperoxide resistance regulator
MSEHAPGAPADALLALDNQLCFALHAASRRVVRAYRPVLSALDLTYPQYLVLLVLWEWDCAAPAKTSLTCLGQRLDLDSGTLTPLLTRLEEKGLVERTRSTHDERECVVVLSPAGRALKARAVEVPLWALRNAPLPVGELVELRKQLTQLRAALAEREGL